MIMGFNKPIEHFNLQQKKVITTNTLYVGIDVSSKSNVIYLMLPNGDKHSNFSVANSHEGSTQLVKRILSALTSHSLDTVLIGLEATSVYGDNLVYFLREDATLAPFNRKIHILNPKQVKKFHDAYNDLPKNDYVDSFVIADCLRFGRINKEVYMGDYRYKALQNLTRARFFAVQNLIKEKQRFMNVLFKKHSTMTQEKVFSDTFSTTALAVYDEFESAEVLANMDLHELTDFIIDKVLSISITSMKALESQIKEFDKAIKAQMELLPNVLISIPGIGPVYSAGIMAEIGDINRFNSQAALAKYAGLAWKQHQSGGFEAEVTRLIPSGNRFLKYYLCEAAFSLVRCDKEYSDFYHLKYKEVNRCQHKRALALTARKFVCLVFRLLKDNRLYCPAK